MKLIPLNAVLAEIDKRLGMLVPYSPFDKGGMVELQVLKDKLNYLEGKEVDLREEIDVYFQKNKNGYNGLLICKKEDFSVIAKHFFELGLNASKPLTWEDVRLLDLLCCKVDMSCDLEEKEHYEEVLKRFKAQKGKKL